MANVFAVVAERTLGRRQAILLRSFIGFLMLLHPFGVHDPLVFALMSLMSNNIGKVRVLRAYPLLLLRALSNEHDNVPLLITCIVTYLKGLKN
jgi:hypothetical protein